MDARDDPGHRCVAVVTGATSGIGLEVARGLAGRGTRLILPVRDRERAIRALGRLADGAEFVVCDLGSLATVRAAAEEIGARADRLDLLIHVAGLLSRRRRLSPDGQEWTLAVNHLGPFLLSRLLEDRLPSGGRVVVVGSTAHSRGRIDFDDMQMSRGYSWWKAYARSKLANLLFSFALARRLADRGVGVDCVHPGVVRTNLAAGWSPIASGLWRLLSPFFRDAVEGAAPVLAAALREAGTGRYFHRFEEVEPNPVARDHALQERLWTWSEAVTGVGS
jgi:NAD(P)-dependent dehydrogenase (short-subunit alcohol dehydrogenase family)